jgi:hypothetical protein
MAGQTISAHVDGPLVQRLKEIAKVDNRPSSHIVGVALKSFLAMTPSARRVAFSIDGSCSAQEQEFAARIVSRSMLKAYQAILESQQMDAIRERQPQAGTNSDLLTEEDIENEAVRACST